MVLERLFASPCPSPFAEGAGPGGVRAALRFRAPARLAPVVGVATHAYQSEGAAFASAPSSSEDSILKGSSTGLRPFYRGLCAQAHTFHWCGCIVGLLKRAGKGFTPLLKSSPVILFLPHRLNTTPRPLFYITCSPGTFLFTAKPRSPASPGPAAHDRARPRFVCQHAHQKHNTGTPRCSRWSTWGYWTGAKRFS
jgi:hypothetical protein